MARNQAESNFFSSKKATAIYGGLFGAAAFGTTLYASPAVIQAATYALANVLSGVLGASVGVYLGAMVAVALAATVIGALLGLAIRAACDQSKTKANDVDAHAPEGPTKSPAQWFSDTCSL